MQGDQSTADAYQQGYDAAKNLKLELISHHSPHAAQEPYAIFDQSGGVVGRGSQCDWVLYCPDRLVSRKHALISYLNGEYFIQDASTNGISLNQSRNHIPQGVCAPLKDGDIISLGDFTIKATLIDSEDMMANIETIVAQPVHAFNYNYSNDATSVSLSHIPKEVPAEDEVQQDISTTAENDTSYGNLQFQPQAPVEPRQDKIPAGISLESRRPRVSAELGHPVDHFAPPKVTIPDDWDLDVSAQSRTPEDVAEKPAVVNFEASAPLPDAFLKGMGVSLPPGQKLSSAQMEVLGRCLRSSIDGLAQWHQSQRDVESALLLEQIVPLDQVSRGVLSSPESFIQAVATMNQQTSSRIVDQFRSEYRFAVDQQRAVVDCLGKVGDVVAEQFTPERIESSFERFKEKQKSKKGKKLMTLFKLKETYSQFFHTYFKLRRREADRALKCIFGQRFLMLYAGRVRGKQNGPQE